MYEDFFLTRSTVSRMQINHKDIGIWRKHIALDDLQTNDFQQLLNILIRAVYKVTCYFSSGAVGIKKKADFSLGSADYQSIWEIDK